jgi:hypothetical protein
LGQIKHVDFSCENFDRYNLNKANFTNHFITLVQTALQGMLIFIDFYFETFQEHHLLYTPLGTPKFVNQFPELSDFV